MTVDDEVGLRRLQLGSVEWIWDEKLEILTLRHLPQYQPGAMCFSLRSLCEFERSFPFARSGWCRTRIYVGALVKRAATKVGLLSSQLKTRRPSRAAMAAEAALENAIEVLVRELELTGGNAESRNWRRMLERLTFLLVCMTSKYEHRWWWCGWDRLAKDAKELAVWLGAGDITLGWSLRYDANLTVDRRCEILRVCAREIARRHTATLAATTDLSDVRIRESYWWTTRSLFDLAAEYDSQHGVQDPHARLYLRSASIDYLSLLKDEPRRQDLERFLAELGTNLDREIRRVFSCGMPALGDAALRQTFLSKHLKRYDLQSAYGLLRSTDDEFARKLLRLGALFALAVGLFWARGHWISGEPWRALALAGQWSCQILFLILLTIWRGALLLVVPRAFYATLIAWLTILLPGALGALAPPDGDLLIPSVHRVLEAPFSAPAQYFLVMFAILVVSFMLLSHEVRAQVWSPNIWGVAFARTLATFTTIIMGSLFWGLLFAEAIPAALGCGKLGCSCLCSAWLLGSSVAVLLGLLVQLLWEDRSIAEPLKDPA